MNLNWSYSLETPDSGQNQRFLSRVTLKFDTWPWKPIKHLFYTGSNILHHFIAICEFRLELRPGNNVQIGAKFNLIFVTLILDLWTWPIVWTSPLSMVITHGNFMMIQWWEHSEKCVRDGRTDGQRDGRTDSRTDWTIHGATWSHLKCYWL